MTKRLCSSEYTVTCNQFVVEKRLELTRITTATDATILGVVTRR